MGAVEGLPALIQPPIGFAHRGARIHERENTAEAFALAIRLGATGLESDVWLSRDGVPVLDHDGALRRRLRRATPISEVAAVDLPAHMLTVDGLFALTPPTVAISLDVKDAAAIEPVLDAAVAAEESMGHPLIDRLWLCSPDLTALAAWTSRWPDVRWVHSTRKAGIDGGPERHAARLAEIGVDAVNMHFSDWTGGLCTLYHRFGVFAFGWDAQHDRMLDELLRMGIDAVYSDHVDRMVDALRRRWPSGPSTVPDAGATES